jgi:hypothetical protein
VIDVIVVSRVGPGQPRRAEALLEVHPVVVAAAEQPAAATALAAHRYNPRFAM